MICHTLLASCLTRHRFIFVPNFTTSACGFDFTYHTFYGRHILLKVSSFDFTYHTFYGRHSLLKVSPSNIGNILILLLPPTPIHTHTPKASTKVRLGKLRHQSKKLSSKLCTSSLIHHWIFRYVKSPFRTQGFLGNFT